MSPFKPVVRIAPGLCAVSLITVLAACAGAPARDTPPGSTHMAVSLPATQVHRVVGHDTQRVYPVWVDLPPSYGTEPERRYPVLYVTDAPWSFPMLHGIRQLMGRGSARFAEFILVGLAPEQGVSLRDSRSRDYTPTDPRQRSGFDPSDYEAPTYGQADAWRRTLSEQIIPLIDSSYRTAPGQRVYAGHSYGGLFGTYVLMQQPDLFNTYILGSPSLWFDQGHMFTIEQREALRRQAAADTQLPARVRMYIGGWERPGDEPRSQGPGGTDMVGDVVRFADTVNSRGYHGLQFDYRILDGEDHGSVYPVFITDALVWAFPGTQPKYRED